VTEVVELRQQLEAAQSKIEQLEAQQLK